MENVEYSSRAALLIREIDLVIGNINSYLALSNILYFGEGNSWDYEQDYDFSNYFLGKFNIFMYWDDIGKSKPTSTLLFQKLFGSSFTLISDADILPLLYKIDPEAADIYTKVSIPACKSDIARLVYSFVFGGLYVDAHCGIGSVAAFEELIKLSKFCPQIFFYQHKDKSLRIYNSFFYTQSKQEIIRSILSTALSNLKDQYQHEMRSGFRSYNIYSLTGPGIYRKHLINELQENFPNNQPFFWHLYDKEDFRTPVLRYQFYQYRIKGRHWSERQQHECLFF